MVEEIKEEKNGIICVFVKYSLLAAM